VLVAREFVEAVEELGERELTPAQKEELRTWRGELYELQSTILYKVLHLGEFVTSSTRTRRRDINSFDACPELVEIAKIEVASGAAQVDESRERSHKESRVVQPIDR
jgi:hypothetical protein